MFKRKLIPVAIGIILLSGIFLVGQDCAAQFDPCNPDPCQGIQNAIPGSCIPLGGSCSATEDFMCGCDTGYIWQDATNTCEESQPSCTDNDGDGYGDPASTLCTYPELDCDDDSSDDPGGCVTCSCGEPECVFCAKCINPDATEVCDAIDNNCDGNVDEGFLRCGDPLHCPAPETCNGLDDDCDGYVDSSDGGHSSICPNDCVWSPEVCDGCDNDCDGVIDDPPPGGFPGECPPPVPSEPGACNG